MDYKAIFDEAIKTGSVLLNELQAAFFADYLVKLGRRKDFFFRAPVDGIVEVLY